jgi:hypothetical protein
MANTVFAGRKTRIRNWARKLITQCDEHISAIGPLVASDDRLIKAIATDLENIRYCAERLKRNLSK